MKTIAVIGGGAAGFFAAIHAKRPDNRVILLEKTATLLAKVRISGGGRCNVTHACFDPKELVKNYPRGNKALLGPFTRFGPQETIAWFAERGVELKTEKDGRMFPITDSSETIIQCLLQEAKKVGVEILLRQRIEAFDPTWDAVILATGSSHQGHDFARKMGHTIVEPVPSLFTFNIPNFPLVELAGSSVQKGKVKIVGFPMEQVGPILVTHWGLSGPAVLKLSAWAARYLHEKEYKAEIIVDWLPDYKEVKEKPPEISKRLWGALDGKKESRFQMEGKTTYKEEFVTAGGVDLDEVNFRTMESKLHKGLYFAGEILDIDGVTGGFNFQNAWTTGYLAGQASGNAAKYFS